MNGREIENLLTLIDQNVAATAAQLDQEVVAYVQLHQDDVLKALWNDGHVDIPTSLSPIRLNLNDLLAAAA